MAAPSPDPEMPVKGGLVPRLCAPEVFGAHVRQVLVQCPGSHSDTVHDVKTRGTFCKILKRLHEDERETICLRFLNDKTLNESQERRCLRIPSPELLRRPHLHSFNRLLLFDLKENLTFTPESNNWGFPH